MSDAAPTDDGDAWSYDLNAIRAALVDAAGISIGLWVSYLLVLTYMLVAVASVTHNDLFFATSVKLPVLSVDLPSAGFFFVGPLLFLIVHAYVLLHFVLLAQKVAAFDEALRQQVRDTNHRAKLREQLPINIFVQVLAGPDRIRNGFIGVLLWLIALVSLMIAPVALMIFFQVQFLPYHDEAITWWQRVLAVMEIALVCSLWPKVGWRSRAGRDGLPTRRMGGVEWLQRTVTVGVIALLIAIPVPFLFFFSTFPGEYLDRGTTRDFAGGEPNIEPRASGLYALLVGAGFDYFSDARRPPSLWPNRLVVSGVTVFDRTKVDSEVKLMHELETARKSRISMETASFRGRNLYQAVLVDAKLQGVSLAQATLTRAVLPFAYLQYADLSRARLEHAVLTHANLAYASLARSHLMGANLARAVLTKADVTDADLTNVDLTNADLTGADLSRSVLKDAEFTDAIMTGTNLSDANLTDVKNLTKEQADQACGNDKTRLPHQWRVRPCPKS